MSQSDLTKENAQNCIDAVKELCEAIPKTRQMDYIGHLNDLYLFLGACKREFKE